MPHSPEVKGFGQGDPALARWADETYRPEDSVLIDIRARSAAEGLPPIAVGKMDGLHLEVLARACAARKAVEIGTLAGYSGVCLLRGMSPDGLLHTFEISEKHARVARESFRRAGVSGQVQVHVGPALEKLRQIESGGPFDLCFLDADKVSYPAYLAWAAEHLRVGGVLLADNSFGWGGVAQQGGDESVQALKRFNEDLARSARFRATILPTAEGLAFGVKIR
jgi:caffeoyl-CoA O-methyltransferase